MTHEIRVAMLHYRDDPLVGGSLRVGATIAKALLEEGVRPSLLFAYGEPGPVTQGWRGEAHFIRSRGFRDIRGWSRLRKVVQDIQPDILHFVDPVVWAQVVLATTGLPRVVHIHGPVIPSRMRLRDRMIHRVFSRTASAQICVAETIRQRQLRQGWARADRAHVIYNAVDTSAFVPRRAKMASRKCLGLPASVKVAAFIGRLTEEKGCLDFPEVLVRLPSEWHGIIAGDGPLKTELIDAAKRAGIGDRLHFLGALPEVRDVYASADVLVFLSRWEAFGLVLAEAMAARLPIFGLAGDGGYREEQYPLVTSHTAVLVERKRRGDDMGPEAPEVLESLADSITNYGRRPELFAPMIHEAHRWVRARFNVKRQAVAIKKIYEAVLKSHDEDVL